jgi:hypothetical protein
VFSETRYAMNGDLRVAYRASREGARDIVFVPALAGLVVLEGYADPMAERIDGFVPEDVLAAMERGAHELKGVPGEWRLFAVASA